MAQPHKHPKSGIYQLRRKVPDALRAALGREFKRSLDTRDPNEAKARFVLAWAESDRVFALARAQLTGEATYSRADAQQLAARWFRAEQERMDQSGDFTGALASYLLAFNNLDMMAIHGLPGAVDEDTDRG